MTKINLATIKPWITKRIIEILGFEDDVVIEFIFNQLDTKHPDGRKLQINLTGMRGLCVSVCVCVCVCVRAFKLV